MGVSFAGMNKNLGFEPTGIELWDLYVNSHLGVPVFHSKIWYVGAMPKDGKDEATGQTDIAFEYFKEKDPKEIMNYFTYQPNRRKKLLLFCRKRMHTVWLFVPMAILCAALVWWLFFYPLVLGFVLHIISKRLNLFEMKIPYYVPWNSTYVHLDPTRKIVYFPYVFGFQLARDEYIWDKTNWSGIAILHPVEDMSNPLVEALKKDVRSLALDNKLLKQDLINLTQHIEVFEGESAVAQIKKSKEKTEAEIEALEESDKLKKARFGEFPKKIEEGAAP